MTGVLVYGALLAGLILLLIPILAAFGIKQGDDQ
jgi:hypothetical protein